MSISKIFDHRKKLEQEIVSINLEQIKLNIDIDKLKYNDIFDPFSIIKNNNDIAVKTKNYKQNFEKINEIHNQIKNTIPRLICSELGKSILEYHNELKINNAKKMKLKKYTDIFLVSTIVVSIFFTIKTARKIYNK